MTSTTCSPSSPRAQRPAGRGAAEGTLPQHPGRRRRSGPRRAEQRYLDLVDNDETAAWNVACTDRDWRAPQRTMALHHADSGAPVYAYDWAFPSTQVGGALGACHALDLPFWFDNLHQPGVDQLGSASDNPQLTWSLPCRAMRGARSSATDALVRAPPGLAAL
ncbi:MAG: hypothetical protein R2710_30840 [Acidimicrobiales bacterium]